MICVVQIDGQINTVSLFVEFRSDPCSVGVGRKVGRAEFRVHGIVCAHVCDVDLVVGINIDGCGKVVHRFSADCCLRPIARGCATNGTGGIVNPRSTARLAVDQVEVVVGIDGQLRVRTISVGSGVRNRLTGN